jgi:hypothetical protein
MNTPARILCCFSFAMASLVGSAPASAAATAGISLRLQSTAPFDPVPVYQGEPAVFFMDLAVTLDPASPPIASTTPGFPASVRFVRTSLGILGYDLLLAFGDGNSVALVVDDLFLNPVTVFDVIPYTYSEAGSFLAQLSGTVRYRQREVREEFTGFGLCGITPCAFYSPVSSTLIITDAPVSASVDVLVNEAVAVVPEPGTYGMILAGLALLGPSYWRRRSRAPRAPTHESSESSR